jgi:putative acetyltransferase
MITIRPEKPEDFDTIYEINRRAFNGEIEARLVDKIRKSDNFIPELSLVALKDNKVVGHILFSKVKIKSEDREKIVLTLAPMAVLPEFQNQGIGHLLVNRGLEISRGLGYYIVVLVGHPDYYPRFGFTPARAKGLEISFKVPIPDEAFMVCELEKNVLEGIKGIVELPPYFWEE